MSRCVDSTPPSRSFVIWDDHEVLNNWYPTEVLVGDSPFTERSVALLAARAKRAFLETATPDATDPERIYLVPAGMVRSSTFSWFEHAQLPWAQYHEPSGRDLGRGTQSWVRRRSRG